MKICTKCGKNDTEVSFETVRNTCKVCKYIYKKQWAKNNPEKVKESRNKWEINNPEKVKANGARAYLRKKNKIVAGIISWPKRNLEYYRKYSKNWKINNPEKVKSQKIRSFERICDSYIKIRVKQSGYNCELPPKLIELIRTNIKVKRIIKSLSNEN